MCVIACAGFRSEWNVCMCVRKRRGECISDDEGFFPVRVCVYLKRSEEDIYHIKK